MKQTTLIVETYRQASSRESHAVNYKGLGIHALPGLHEFIATQALSFLKPGCRVLDLAAGSGALSLRLFDLGFSVSATDFVTENFQLKAIPFCQADLNTSFSEKYQGPFSALVASEIIEHLENPRHFARQCFHLLEPGGRLILSTPNVENVASLASFVRSGRFLWFLDKDYEQSGHITPLTRWQIHKAFEESGFTLVFEGSFGMKPSQLGGSPRLRILTWLLEGISQTSAELGGEIYVAVLEKPANCGDVRD